MTIQGYADLIDLLGAGAAHYALQGLTPPSPSMVIEEIASHLDAYERDKLTQWIIVARARRPSVGGRA